MRGHYFSFRVFFLLASLAPALAATNLKLIRSASLETELCGSKLQQTNSPLSGVDFLSEDELVVYTVCREGVALSLRDRFQPTDPNHLKAVVLDLATGAVTRRFDWPTHGHASSLTVTHDENLLLRRDNELQLLTPDGKVVKRLRINKPGHENQILLSASPAVEAFAVAVTSMSQDGHVFSGVGVLDARNLQVLVKWPQFALIWSVAASSTAAARTVGAGPQLDVRDFKSDDWRTIAKSSDRSLFSPVFVNDSELAVPSDNKILLYDISGQPLAALPCPNALKAAVSREGNVLAAMCVKSSLGPSTLPVYGAQFGSMTFELYKLPDGQPLGSVDESTAPAFRFDFALSPSGSRLAVVDNLKLSVWETHGPAPSGIQDGTMIPSP